jgi:prevent-host-death family protein
MTANTWKLQDAKAQLSEVVRRARAGEPQQVTVHGKQAVVIVDPERFEIRPKSPVQSMAEFVARSRNYALDEDISFDRPLYMEFPEPDFLTKGEPE